MAEKTRTNPIEVETEQRDSYLFVDIKIGGTGLVTPKDIDRIVAKLPNPEQFGENGVVLSGRLPVWIYASAVHQLHPFAWVGTFDPRLGGAVVVASHIEEVATGDIIKIGGGGQ